MRAQLQPETAGVAGAQGRPLVDRDPAVIEASVVRDARASSINEDREEHFIHELLGRIHRHPAFSREPAQDAAIGGGQALRVVEQAGLAQLTALSDLKGSHPQLLGGGQGRL